MSKRLDGKVAIVTGASKGLGAEIARQFAAEGASVVVNYSHSKDAADAVVGEIDRAGGKAVAVQADMSDEAQVRRLFAEAHRAFGPLDILVNNAGVYDFQPLENLSLELFRRHFDLNVYGYLTAIREGVQYMRAGSSIINMSSTVTIFGPSNASVYTATKGAIDALTRALSNELAPREIRVNAIKPGVVDTEGVEAGGFLTGAFGKALVEETPLGRLGRSEDVAPAAVYLASDESAWMTGEYITMAGGQR
ncbi:SDR family NAD(P)-dependent oxidoreductase [Mycolicibacterium obuense]|uniref:Short-chain dehydrogenase n=1 Tax=Mycolicibacterium obuense TaxID=1807 RepID=A0A0M2K4W3_9MYCO|nr:glucose 1-dehydrogenase [Mycolicibacterium obuense]KKF01973.1 short-chain dehydrogenase [Mycolicibacterium obuense]